MKFIADFHIHSRYSRATSKELVPEKLDYWARIKGLKVVGTGDFTHPAWAAELNEKLEPAEEGLFKLREKFAVANRVLPAGAEQPRFVYSTEISCIYKKAGAVRKLHHLILCPSVESAGAITRRLAKIGNLKSDGRPILGLDSKILLEIVLEAGAGAVLIPAHIWTPWFSLFGSKSGFNKIEDCFDELSREIFALETGLSSDPAMNWRLSVLDRFSMVSNSDAHSPKNLAREANIFNCDLTYNTIIAALRDPKKGFLGTVEFFPEEGKYHYDGHRKCGVLYSPAETKKHKGLCPVCGKPLTIGVMNRVDELADRPEPQKPARSPGFSSLVPLPEVIGELLGVGGASKKVGEEYFRLIEKVGPELNILMDAPLERIKEEWPLLAEAIGRMREGRVHVRAGYDGEYGVIKVFEASELKSLAKKQGGFFPGAEKAKPLKIKAEDPPKGDSQKFSLSAGIPLFAGPSLEKSATESGLDDAQQQAVEYEGRALLIKAGPGTGKTRTLTHRIAYLVEKGKAEPEKILALTFTNQAGQEMRARLQTLLGEKAEAIFIGTFHSFALKLLRETDGQNSKLSIIDQDAKLDLLRELASEMGSARVKKVAELISRTKMYLVGAEEMTGGDEFARRLAEIYRAYQVRLAEASCMDFDDLIFHAARKLQEKDFGDAVRSRRQFIFVDEYQDLDFAQYQMVRLLAGTTGKICVIGDPNQAIYGFRGANPEFFRRFTRDFPDARVIQLQKSFRSSDQILQASSQTLPAAEGAGLRSGRSGARLKIIELATERAEAEFIVHEIEKLVGGVGFFSFDSARVQSGERERERSFGDIAVLFRSSSQVPALLEAFSRSGMPYRLLSESPLRSRFFKTGLRVLQIVAGEPGPLLLRLALKEIFPGSSKFPADRTGLASWLQGQKKNESAENLLHLLAKTDELGPLEICGQAFSLAGAGEEDAAEKEMVRELALDLVRRRARQSGVQTPAQIIELLNLASPRDFYDPDADRVSLLTMHSAKGLEFEAVFVAGCEEGVIPHISARTPAESEEEARLFYVALTRAKNLLYLTRARKRMVYGKTSGTKPSRFVLRIQEELLDKLRPEPLPAKSLERQLDLFRK